MPQLIGGFTNSVARSLVKSSCSGSRRLRATVEHQQQGVGRRRAEAAGVPMGCGASADKASGGTAAVKSNGTSNALAGQGAKVLNSYCFGGVG